MKGLIVKDLLVLRKQLQLLGGFAAFYTILGIVSPEMLTIYGTVFITVSCLMPVTAMAYDKQCSWEKFALSTPLTSRQFALEKYVLGGLMLLVSFALSSLIGVIICRKSTFSYGQLMLTFCIAAAAGILMLSLMIPLTCRFGAERTRMIMILAGVVPMMLASILSEYLLDGAVLQRNIKTIVVVGFVIIAVIAAVSVFLTCRICENKEY